MSDLDGVTVAYDYPQALLELDRGYETIHRLQPSEGEVFGVAMTPSVIREGVLKSHIVLHAGVMEALIGSDEERIGLALHTLAHECAHVEVTKVFDAAIPGVRLRRKYTDHRMGLRWQIILACWDEYAATRLSAGFGKDPTDAYEETLITNLSNVRDRANDFIRRYRTHKRHDQVLYEVYGAYGQALKFAAYYLGTIDGLELPLTQKLSSFLPGHWFEPFLHRLHEICRTVAGRYGSWRDEGEFEPIGDLGEELLAWGGINLRSTPEGGLHVDVPFTPETM